MNFLQHIISPFIFIIEQVFLFSYKLTENYGISIVFLSFAVSLLLLPVFIYIEKAKKKDDVIKQKMKPLIDEIKRVYKGQERYYYIKTINRQHNYSSLKALIPILSLLIQIPFFIAAYQYLEHFEGLKGVSFTFIKDLGSPDAVFGVVNILPVLMTIVNLITVYYYTRLGDGSERKQMLIIAIAFLVFLFNLPAGLVLYWTLNNVFSFLRLFITNPEVFKKKKGAYSFSNFISEYKLIIPLIKKLFFLLSLIAISVQINWAYKHSFDGFALRLFWSIAISFLLNIIVGIGILAYRKNKRKILDLEMKPWLFFSLLFGVVYFSFAGRFYYTGVNDSFLYISLSFLVPLQILGGLQSTKLLIKQPTIINWTLYLGLVFLLIYQLIILVFESLFITDVVLSFTYSSKLTLILTGLIYVLISLFFILKKKEFTPITLNNKGLIYTLSVLYFTGLIFFWHPILSYSSYPSIFNFPIIDIFLRNGLVFLIVSSFLLLIFFVNSKLLKGSLVFISVFVTIVSFINTSIIPFELGTLQTSVFSHQDNLAAPIIDYLIEAVLLLTIIIVLFKVLIKQYSKLIIGVLILLNSAIITQSIYKAIETGRFLKLETDLQLKPGEISFSKEKKNTIVLMLDGFQGWYVKRIIKDIPRLKETLNGFVWYPNTASISNLTHSSLPSIMCGHKYDPIELNRDSIHSISQKITSASKNYVNRVHGKNMNFISSKMHHSAFDVNKFDMYIPSWEKEWSQKLNIDETKELWFNRLYENALLFSVPIIFKPIVYNDSKWIAGYFRSEKIKHEMSSEANKYNFLRILPKISNTNSSKGSFVYFHSMTPHIPWNKISEDGEFIKDVSPYENNKWVILMVEKWVLWLKENNIYDNTKIILVSDHGVSWDIYDGVFPQNSLLSFDKNKNDLLTEKEFWRLNPLLMVKDYNSTELLSEDGRLMCNADASQIAFYDDYISRIKENEPREITTVTSWWSKDILENKKFNSYKVVKVKDNIFDLKNWELINKK